MTAARSLALSVSMRRRRRAYTLFELIVVMGILVIFAVMAYPSLDSMYADYKVSAAVDGVRAAWARGRTRAINDSQPYRFSVNMNGSGYRLAPDSGDYWAGDGTTVSSITDPNTVPLILEQKLPKGITFSGSETAATSSPSGSQPNVPQQNNTSGTWTTVVRFLPDGTGSADVELTFHARGARPRRLTLRAFTGVVSDRSIK